MLAPLLASSLLTAAVPTTPRPSVQTDDARPTSIEVTVTDATTGRPIQNAELFLVEEAPAPTFGLFAPPRAVRTDAGGHATVPVADERHPVLVARAEGYGVLGEFFRVGPLEVELYPEAPLTVEVIDFMGRPVPDAHLGVAVGCGHTPDVLARRTDAKGRATFTGVAPQVDILDLYPVHASLVRDDYDRLPYDYALDGVGRVVVGPGTVLRGQVIDAEGAPVAGVFVGSPLRHRGPWAETDAEGRFALFGISPRPGDVQVVDADGEHIQSFGPSRAGVERVLRLGEDAMPDEAESARLAVRLQDTARAAGVPVTVWNVATGAAERGRLDGDGKADFVLAPGDYGVEIGGLGAPFAPEAGVVSLEAGSPLLYAVSEPGPKARALRVRGATPEDELVLWTADGAQRVLDAGAWIGDAYVMEGFVAPCGDWSVWTRRGIWAGTGPLDARLGD